MADERALQGRRDAESAFTQQMLGGLQPQYQQAMGGLNQEFAGRLGGFRQGQQQAMGGLGQAQQDIMSMLRPQATHLTGGGTMAAALAANLRESQRAAPHTQLRANQMAMAGLQPGTMRAHNAFGNSMAGLQRQSGEMLGDSAIRQAMLGGDAMNNQRALDWGLNVAGTRGAFAQSLGQFGMNLAPGLMAAMMPRRGAAEQTQDSAGDD
jgi:hypothetical protein